jgi:uncharacterized protein YqgV (UPF0045/DUF77 family)
VIGGYDPDRIAGLEYRTRWALERLDTITSHDDAAHRALAAAERLRGVLATGFVPAVAAIRSVDPLAAEAACSVDGWLRTHLGDIDLVVLLRVELTRQIEAHGSPDPDDPFWTGEFHEWVAEFERRARLDPDFGEFLAAEAAANPMIGEIVAAGHFDGDVLLTVTEALLAGPSSGAMHDTYRDGAINSLLATIAARPPIALTLLGPPGAVERLLAWNDGDGGAFGLDGEVVGAVFSSALRHALDDAERLHEARAVLATLAELAHGPRFDRGFPPGTATGVTTGLLSHLPSLLDSLRLDADVYFTDDHGRFETQLGSSAAVVDLFGALMRDGSSRVMLLAAIPGLTVGADDLDAVNDYVNTLIQAAETEQIEEEIHAGRTQSEWNTAIDVVASILETAFDAGGTRLAIAKEVANVVEVGAHWLVERIAADELGLDDTRTTAFLLLTYGVSVAFLDRRRDDDEDPRLAEADEIADEVERLLDDNGSRDDVEREVRNLRTLIEELGDDDALATLRDPRIAPPAYDATDDADLAD